MRRTITVKDKKVLVANSGNICMFPGCNQTLTTDTGDFIGVFCHIEAISPGSPRYNPQNTIEKIDSIDNLILLCPNHHSIIDRSPFQYTTEWLKHAKEEHQKYIAGAIKKSPFKLEIKANLSLKESLEFWRSNQTINNEELWQSFFSDNPKIIAHASPNHIVQIGKKCYVGGKTIENRGGNLVDFLYANASTRNVLLVEIKTPQTKLIGKHYRMNAYALNEQLIGAIIQILNYKDELLKNYYSLIHQEHLVQFSAFNPKCLVIAGNLKLENLDGNQRKSFELFRSNLSSVDIITYDELFDKIQDIVDISTR